LRLPASMQQFTQFDGMAVERLKMNHYFVRKYGTDAKVDLLTFYEDFFRDFKKPEKEMEDKAKEAKAKQAQERAELIAKGETPPEAPTEEKQVDPRFDVPALTERGQRLSKFTDALETALNEKVTGHEDEVRLVAADLDAAQATLPPKPDYVDESNFFGSFMQFYEGNGADGTPQLHAVTNATFAGYGKMLSRFLHIFPDKVTDTIREWNTRHQGDDEVYVEDCDASYFNANLHPPLMPFEIWMPGGHNSLPPEQQLPITEFEVAYKANQGGIELRHKPTNRKAYVFDLGFQGQMGRSQLFQLLDKFSRARYLFTNNVVSGVNTVFSKKKAGVAGQGKEAEAAAEAAQAAQGPKVNVHPRIVYEDQVVLQRKAWHVPKSLVPERLPEDDDATYYLKVNQWRLGLGMPDEVFVVLNSDRMGTQMVDPEKMRRLTRDDYKPQYMNFTSPLFVGLFEKMMVKVPATVKITEMLPNTNQLLKIDGQRYVSEFMIQWYN